MTKKYFFYFPVVLCSFMALNQFYLVQTKDVSPWIFGGFAMFSKFTHRELVISGIPRGGDKEMLINLSEKLYDQIDPFNNSTLDDVRDVPLDRYFSKAVEGLSQMYVIPNHNSFLLQSNSKSLFQHERNKVIPLQKKERDKLKIKNLFSKLYLRVWEGQYNKTTSKVEYALLKEQMVKL